MEPTDLLDAATTAAHQSYSPYSSFRVGAVAVAEDGSTFAGTNVENAAYGASICAEANAITTAAAAGVRQIDTVAVVCLDGDLCTPCGNCRQIMREFGVKRIVMRRPDGSAEIMTLDEILPRSFGPEAL